MRLLTMSVRPLAVLVVIVALQACARPEMMPEAAADAAIRIQESAEAEMAINLPAAARPLKCKKLQGPGSNPEWVGSDGDTLKTKGHSLYIPPNALGSRVRMKLSDGNNEDGRVIITAIPNVTFAAGLPAVLTVNFAHCEVPDDAKRLIVYRTDLDQTSVPQFTVVDNIAKTATVELDSLSTYLIAAN